MILLLLFSQIDSLSLDQTIALAFHQSPTYYESMATLDKTRILFYHSLANLLPTLSANVQYTKSDEYNDSLTSYYSGSLNLSMPVFDLDVISAIFVANLQLKGGAIQHQANTANMILKIKTAYYNLVNARELIKSTEIAIARAEENSKLVATKYELGTASRLELLQAEVFYLRTLQDRASAKTREITAQEELKSLLSIEHDVYPVDTLTNPEYTELPDLDSLILILQKANYDIRTARELRNIAKLQLISSCLGFLPKVSFFYNRRFMSDSLVFDFQYYEDISRKNYGVSVALPIFEIKSLVFNYLEARKELQLQEFAKKRVTLQSAKALRTTYFTLIESLDKLRYAQKGLDAAYEAVSIAREQYTLGVLSLLDYLKAEQDLYDARVSYNSALSDYYLNKANFSYLLGGLVLNKETK